MNINYKFISSINIKIKKYTKYYSKKTYINHLIILKTV